MALRAISLPGAQTQVLVPGGRMVEWCVLAVLVLVFAGFTAQHVLDLKGQTERAAVLSTLGAIRTALVIDHLQRVTSREVTGQSAAPANPFLTLQKPPPNYRGEMAVLEALEVPPGSWVFDPQNLSIGYMPQDPHWYDDNTGTRILWFRTDQGPGPRALLPLAPYVWRGVLVN